MVVDGVLKLPPAGTKQKVELRVEKVVHVGLVVSAKYPWTKTRLTLKSLVCCLFGGERQRNR
jgi:asparaginyl-tRNA synthetase